MTSRRPRPYLGRVREKQVREAVPLQAERRLSPGQERLWLLDQLQAGAGARSLCRRFALEGALDVARLELSLAEVVRRHEVLRTSYPAAGGVPVAMVAAVAGWTLPVEDLSRLSAPEQAERVSARVQEATRRRFDLAAGPVVHARLMRLEARRHVLLLAAHPIACDERSFEILAGELAAVYEALSSGRPAPGEGSPCQYGDWVVRQGEWLAGAQGNALREYWAGALGGAPLLLELPTDRARPAAPSNRAGVHRFELDLEGVDRLRRLGGPQATRFEALLAVFQILLSRHAGQEDLLVGTPAERSASAPAGLVGPLDNTLVLRGRLTGNPTVGDFLRRVVETCRAARQHQELPFEALVSALAPGGDLAVNPLVQVSFALEGPPLPPLEAGDLNIRLLPSDGEDEVARLDLALAVREVSGRLEARLEYDADLFDAATAGRMADQLGTLVQSAADAGGARCSTLALLTTTEERRLLEWNATAAEYPEGRLVHEMVEAQVERTPEASALAWAGGTLSYRELNRRANRLAHHLRDLGVGPESLVAVCMERSSELVVALLAILKAGGAYVPLDPAYPPERVALMLADAAAAVLLTEDRLLPRLPAGHGARVVRLDADASLLAACPDTNLAPLSDAESLAYVIYTSGSTGRPKGVALTHRSVVAFLAWSHSVFAPQQLAGTLASTSICFDLSVFEIFAPLTCGGRVILARDALELPEHPLAGEVTLVNTVPSAMTELVRLRALPAAVRTVNLAGEALPLRLVQDLYGLGHVEQVYNLYGPSEDTTYSTFTLVPRPCAEAPTIGRPIANTQTHILDRHRRPVPLGAVGELYVGGAGLARGYLGRPDLTAERFVPDPGPGHPGARLYRTGDLARQRLDGEIVFLGRIDHQVKVRGFRIEPGEVEDALVRHAGVAAAVVVARPLRAGAASELVAYVVAPGGQDAGALRARLRQGLPEHMVPGRIVFLDRLPLTPNGKVDRKALPDPARAVGEGGQLAPRTTTEQVLAALWADLLGLERVGADADFFALGGHSLLATQMVSRARDAFGLDLPLTAVFEERTLARLAARVDALRRQGHGSSGPPLQRVGGPGPHAASFAQERLWIADQLGGGRAAYNVPWAFRLEGRLDVAALERALGEIVRRHEALRTVFVTGERGPLQQVLPCEGFTLPLDDLSALPAAAAAAEAERRLDAEIHLPFDLARGPVLRARLLRISEREHVLALTIHHIATDGWSLTVLLDELAAHYTSSLEGRPSSMHELPIQYADYAAWQRATLPGPALERALDCWRRRLAGAPPRLDLPSDRPRPSQPSFRGGRRALLLPGPLVAAIEKLARQAGATPFMGLLAGFATLLGRLAGQTDVVIGSPVAHRTRNELEPLIGFFVNVLALRVDLSGNPSFREVLARVRDVSLEAYAHQDLPFERLVEELQPERQLGHTPLFQVVAALQNVPAPRTSLPGLALTPLDLATRSAKYDLTLFLEERKDGLLATIEYAEDLFDARRIERLLGHLRALLAAAAADPETPIERLPLLTDEEQRDREAWNATALPVGPETVVDLVQARARTRPDGLALSAPSCRLTYAQLDEESGRLARRLCRLGVERESRVAICMEPSPRMVVAALAVLKAGGAYVPLDPAYPRERLSYLLADARAHVLLADRSTAGRLPATETPILSVDGLDADGEAEAGDDAAASPDPDNLAYVVYTSGSTGRPKGVAVPHRGLANLVAWHQARYALTATDRTSQIAAPGFDAAVWEIWPTLAAGASLHFPPAETRLSPSKLLAWLAGERITVAFLPTPLAEAALAEEWPAGLALRALLTGGDRLTRRPSSATPFRVVNHYGPTEVSVVTTAADVAPDVDGPPPIGHPIANLRVHAVDPRFQAVPEGVPGELYVGGAGLARGYLNRPDWTAERFVPDPSSTEPGGRLYRTGDLVSFRSDGGLDFVGRADRQVKLRGFRIEPAEIEAALAVHPALENSVVAVREDRLVAYVVARSGASWAEEELREFLRDTLPEYMVPAAFVAMGALPLTPNGKIDREALPAPALTRPPFGPPETALEKAVAEIWQELLGAPSVGRSDDFFALGGHSLLAGQAVARLQKSLGLPVSLPMLFEAPTVAGLAAALATLGAADVSEPRLRRIERSSYRVTTPDPEAARG
jgi:amino acid adenylation domain-containing protein